MVFYVILYAHYNKRKVNNMKRGKHIKVIKTPAMCGREDASNGLIKSPYRVINYHERPVETDISDADLTDGEIIAYNRAYDEETWLQKRYAKVA